MKTKTKKEIPKQVFIQKQILNKIQELMNDNRYNINDVTVMVERLSMAFALLSGKRYV